MHPNVSHVQTGMHGAAAAVRPIEVPPAPMQHRTSSIEVSAVPMQRCTSSIEVSAVPMQSCTASIAVSANAVLRRRPSKQLWSGLRRSLHGCTLLGFPAMSYMTRESAS
jgi:hypothetical protein